MLVGNRTVLREALACSASRDARSDEYWSRQLRDVSNGEEAESSDEYRSRQSHEADDAEKTESPGLYWSRWLHDVSDAEEAESLEAESSGEYQSRQSHDASDAEEAESSQALGISQVVCLHANLFEAPNVSSFAFLRTRGAMMR